MGSENETLRRRIEEETSKVNDLKQENENKLTEKKKLEEVILNLKNQFIEKKDNLEKKEKELNIQMNNLDAQISSKDFQIYNLNNQINIRDNQINGLQIQINNMNNQDNQINYLNNQINIRDNQINNLNNQINNMNNQNAQINYLNNQINIRDNQIKNLSDQIDSLKNYNNKLYIDCGQYQLMIQNLMCQNFIQNNLNNIININNKSQNFNLVKYIMFQFEIGKKCSIKAIDICRLKDLYYKAFTQINIDEYSNINNLKFSYNSKDITSHFLKNDFFGSLNLPNFGIIMVMKLNNFSNQVKKIF